MKERIDAMVCLRTALVASVALVMGAGLTGCGGDRGPERVIVSGTVTHNGKPIPNGEIRFVPAPPAAVPVAIAQIVDGRYRVDHHGGVPVGTHKVEIQAFNMPSKPVPLGPAPQNYLPRRFNADSQLKMTVESGSREISKDFALID